MNVYIKSDKFIEQEPTLFLGAAILLKPKCGQEPQLSAQPKGAIK